MIAIIFIAITAFTYSHILTRPNMIFSWPYKKLNQLFKTDERQMKFAKGMHPLFKMIMGCELCVSGQMALWTFLYFNWYAYILDTVFYHIAFICTTIFLTSIIKHLYQKHIENGN